MSNGGIMLTSTASSGPVNLLYSVTPTSGNSVNLIIPTSGDDTLVTEDEQQILSNKTLNAVDFTGISTGLIQNSSQYCFEAYNTTAPTGITGSGTAALIVFDTILYQVGTGYDATTGVFTAPVSGKYLFNCGISAQGFSSSNSTFLLAFNVNGTNYYLRQNTGTISDLNGVIGSSMTKVFNLNAGDVVAVQFAVGGSTTANITLDGGKDVTWFQGFLLDHA